MTATRKEIKGWVDELFANPEYTHLVVACDTWDYDNYPVFVKQGEDVREVYNEHVKGDFNKVDEVYSRNHDRDEQMREWRALHFD